MTAPYLSLCCPLTSTPQARHDGQNYVFSLLLGYREPPAGITVRARLLVVHFVAPGLR